MENNTKRNNQKYHTLKLNNNNTIYSNNNQIDSKGTNTKTTILKINSAGVFFPSIALLIFMIIAFFIILFNVNIISAFQPPKSQDELIRNTSIILFFSMFVVLLCILFLPNLREFKEFFIKIGNTTYFLIYTFFFILFYTTMPSNTLNTYYYLFNLPIFTLGFFLFYKAGNHTFMEKNQLNYQQMKTMILLFCLMAIFFTFYNVNPGGITQTYFSVVLLIYVISIVFGLLYFFLLIGFSEKVTKNKEKVPSPDGLFSFGRVGGVLFFLFLSVVSYFMITDKATFFHDQQKSGALISLLLLICVVWSVLLGADLFSGDTKISNIKTIQQSILLLFGIVVSLVFIVWLLYNIQQFNKGPTNTTIITFVLSMTLILLIAGLMYKTFTTKLPVGNEKKNEFFKNTSNYFFLFVQFISQTLTSMRTVTIEKEDWKSIYMVFIVLIVFILYFNLPLVFNLISNQGGQQLVNKPVYTDTQYNLGNYETLNGSDTFYYQYAISFWFYIDAAPPNMNPNYTKYTSLLNFGNKPNVLFNSQKNELMVTMQQKNLNKVTKNALIDFDENGHRIIYTNKDVLLQKWNNMIINYNGGTMDIFLNGELVKSTIEVVPYYTIDNLTIGENNGIKGGICNVIYFRKPLSAHNVYFTYHTVKRRTPPTLNESEKTILAEST